MTGIHPAIARALLAGALSVIAAATGPATAQAPPGAREFEIECARCHVADTLRRDIGGLRRLYWTDDRLARFLQRHHSRDEDQARLIIRFLRGDPP